MVVSVCVDACVCVLCLKMDGSISFSVFQHSGRETGQLNFSLAYFMAVPCFQESSSASSPFTLVQHLKAWARARRHFGRDLFSLCWIPSGTVPLMLIPDVYLLWGSSSAENPTDDGRMEMFHPTIQYYIEYWILKVTHPTSLHIAPQSILTPLHPRILVQFCWFLFHLLFGQTACSGWFFLFINPFSLYLNDFFIASSMYIIFPWL